MPARRPRDRSSREEARPRRHRRDEARDARAGGGERPHADAQAPARGGPARRRLRGRLPVGHAGLRRVDRHRDRPGRARDPGDELVPPRRGPLHRVRHELPRLAVVRAPPVAHGHDLQHEPRAPLEGRADGVRATRRRRPAHGRHHLPDVPRPPPPRGLGRHRAHPHRLDGLPPRRLRPEGALLRRHVRLAAHAVPLAARAAGHPRPALGLRRRVPRRERPVRLPAALAARQRHPLAQERPVSRRSSRWPPPTARSSGC